MISYVTNFIGMSISVVIGAMTQTPWQLQYHLMRPRVEYLTLKFKLWKIKTK